MRVIELTSFGEVEDYGTCWDDLLNACKDDNIFLTREWLETWWKHLGAKRELLLLAVEDRGRLLAVAPLMKSKYSVFKIGLNVIEFIGSPQSDYHSFILIKDSLESVRLLMNYIKEQDWDCVELKNIPENSETLKTLETVSKKTAKLKKSLIDICLFVPLPESFEEFSQKISKSMLKNIHRYGRKLKREHKIELKSFNDMNLSIQECMKTFFKLHQQRWQNKGYGGLFATPVLRNFHIDLAKRFNQRGWLGLNFLCCDDEPIAAKYAFHYKGKVYAYLSGFNPKYARYGVGTLTTFYEIQEYIKNGFKEYDLLRGAHPHKFRLGSKIRKNFKLSMTRRKPLPQLYTWIVKKNIMPSLTNWLRQQALDKHLVDHNEVNER